MDSVDVLEGLEKRMKHFLKKKKLILFSVLLLTLGAFQFLNFTGFCYADMRYFSDQELLDRALFGKEGPKMTYAEKLAATPNAKLKSSLEGPAVYPDCCIVRRLRWDRHFWRTFFQGYRVEIEIVLPRKTEPENTNPYKERTHYIKSCGTKTVGSSGISVSADSYYSTLKHNRQFWKEKQP